MSTLASFGGATSMVVGPALPPEAGRRGELGYAVAVLGGAERQLLIGSLRGEQRGVLGVEVLADGEGKERVPDLACHSCPTAIHHGRVLKSFEPGRLRRKGNPAMIEQRVQQPERRDGMEVVDL